MSESVCGFCGRRLEPGQHQKWYKPHKYSMGCWICLECQERQEKLRRQKEGKGK